MGHPSFGTALSGMGNALSKFGQGVFTSVKNTAHDVAKDVGNAGDVFRTPGTTLKTLAGDISGLVPVGSALALGSGASTALSDYKSKNTPEAPGAGADVGVSASPTTTPPPAPPPANAAGGSSTTTTSPNATNPAGNPNPAPDVPTTSPAYTPNAPNPTVEAPIPDTQRRGLASTILTGESGVNDEPPTARRRLTAV